jgi:hypothetical protein
MRNNYLIFSMVLLLLVGGMAGYIISTGLNGGTHTVSVVPITLKNVTTNTTTTPKVVPTEQPTATPVYVATPTPTTPTAAPLNVPNPGYFDQGIRYGINAVPPGVTNST